MPIYPILYQWYSLIDHPVFEFGDEVGFRFESRVCVSFEIKKSIKEIRKCGFKYGRICWFNKFLIVDVSLLYNL